MPDFTAGAKPRITAWHGDEARSGNLGPVQLRQSVDRGLQQLRVRVSDAVVGLVVLDVLQAIVGGEVDNHLAEVIRLRDHVRARRMRQAEDEDVGRLGGSLDIKATEHGVAQRRRQMRVEISQALACRGVSAAVGDLEVRVPPEDCDRLLFSSCSYHHPDTRFRPQKTINAPLRSGGIRRFHALLVTTQVGLATPGAGGQYITC
jgi:hypothetical protein